MEWRKLLAQRIDLKTQLLIKRMNFFSDKFQYKASHNYKRAISLTSWVLKKSLVYSLLFIVFCLQDRSEGYTYGPRERGVDCSPQHMVPGREV